MASDATDKSHSQRLESIEAAQQNLAQMLKRAEDADLDPDRVRADHPNSKLHRRLHIAAIDFCREMWPYRDRQMDTFSDPLPAGAKEVYEFEVPDPDVNFETARTADRSNNARLAGSATLSRRVGRKHLARNGGGNEPALPTTSERIRIGKVGDWKNRYVRFPAYEVDDEDGLIEVERQIRLLLPLRACEAIYDALTDVRDNIPNLGVAIGPGNDRGDPF